MVYVVSFEKVESGGPELLHQLVYVLNMIGVGARIVYVNNVLPPEIVKAEPIAAYEKYNCLTEDDISVMDQEGNVIVLPEIAFSMFERFEKAIKVAWWLSVDGYKSSIRVEHHLTEEDLTQIEHLDHYGFRNRTDILHLVQSYYAQDFLEHTIGVSKEYIDYLSDYINDLYLQDDIPEDLERKDMVLFNPQKGGWRLKKLIDETQEEFLWVPLQNMTREKMRLHMLLAKVYVDFGNHPGKDRIPREAAISGCCVITGRQGAAAFYDDVPIPDRYKVDDSKDVDVEKVRGLIEDIFENFQERTKDFDSYREMIRGEKERFVMDVMRLFR